MRKKLIAGAAVLALLMSAPQARADNDIVVFGGEFDEEKPAPKKKPEPIRELPPEETNAPFEEPTPIDSRDESTDEPEEPAKIEPIDEKEPPHFDEPPLQPVDESEEPAPIEPVDEEEPPQIEPLDESPLQPVDEPEEPAPIEPIDEEEPPQIEPFDELPLQPVDEPEESAQIEPVDEPTEPPLEDPQPVEEPSSQIEPSVVEPTPPIEIERPFEPPTRPVREEPVPVVPPTPAFKPPTPPPQPIIEEPAQIDKPVVKKSPTQRTKTPRQVTPRTTQPRKDLKLLKPRFVKLAVDDTYTYYLDKESVQWKKMPYSTSEYIADVWIRMIEREPAQLEDDMAAYGADNFNAEVALAAEQGYQYSPDDLAVLRNQGYVLEHYYLRPKTNQIQFLCELEVFGRPQNTINERAYDYKNWENLVPGSVESIIYATVIKTIGKSKATERGHMTFIDMLEEYGRISLR